MRINRYLAQCGLGSRRKCESLVLSGIVSLNGEPCLDLSTQVSPNDQVQVDDKIVAPQTTQTLLLHKPLGVVCTRHDPQGRSTIYDLLPGRFHHLAHIGRLDRESEGALLLSNDGALAEGLTHPRHHIAKHYAVTLDRAFDLEKDRHALINGIELEGKLARISKLRLRSPRRLELLLHQGLKRQIREMFKARGYRVKKLHRSQIGDLELGTLALGKWRLLKDREILALKALCH